MSTAPLDDPALLRWLLGGVVTVGGGVLYRLLGRLVAQHDALVRRHEESTAALADRIDAMESRVSASITELRVSLFGAQGDNGLASEVRDLRAYRHDHATAHQALEARVAIAESRLRSPYDRRAEDRR